MRAAVPMMLVAGALALGTVAAMMPGEGVAAGAQAGAATSVATVLSPPSSVVPPVPSTPAPTFAAPPSNVAPRACLDPAAVDAWPLERRVAQLLMVGVPVSRSARAEGLVRTYGVGGILVRGTPSTASRRALAAVSAAGGSVPPFIGIDEEGGRVQHLRQAAGMLPSARAMAKTMTPAEVRAMARSHGEKMRAIGFTLNFAPVLDLTAAGNRRNGIGDRSFSSDPTVAAEYGTAFAQGMADAGLLPVVKHFPGHGRAKGDSHQVGPSVPSLDELRGYDLLPFVGVLKAVPVGVMMAHVYVVGLDIRPASLSPAIIQTVLRKELGHRGLVFTDSLSMRPIRYHFAAAEAARLALYAGNDVLLFDDEPDVAGIITSLSAAVPYDAWLRHRLGESLTRVLRAKGVLCEALSPAIAGAP